MDPDTRHAIAAGFLLPGEQAGLRLVSGLSRMFGGVALAVMSKLAR